MVQWTLYLSQTMSDATTVAGLAQQLRHHMFALAGNIGERPVLRPKAPHTTHRTACAIRRWRDSSRAWRSPRSNWRTNRGIPPRADAACCQTCAAPPYLPALAPTVLMQRDASPLVWTTSYDGLRAFSSAPALGAAAYGAGALPSR